LRFASSGIRARTLFVYFKQREKVKEERVVEDSVVIARWQAAIKKIVSRTVG
jgi:hypothetical protein